MIRFGKFEGFWGYKTNTDVNKRIYPVPISEKALSHNQVQPPGY